MTAFDFYRFRFHFRALGTVHFPRHKSGNVARGAFGSLFRRSAPPALYARLFEPSAALGPSPSGLGDWPRPFVFRAAHLDGRTVPPDEPFFLDIHVFDVRNPVLPGLRDAFGRWERAALERVEQLDLDGCGLEIGAEPLAPCTVDLEPAPPESTTQITLRFLTPTKLKTAGATAAEPEFPILFARVRDRIATLRALYGKGALEVDFRGLGERAATVRLTRCDLEWQNVLRRSGRTGQIHSIGGFTGVAEYAGQLGEFLPWLHAGQWTGVGRHTVWGAGSFVLDQ